MQNVGKGREDVVILKGLIGIHGVKAVDKNTIEAITITVRGTVGVNSNVTKDNSLQKRDKQTDKEGFSVGLFIMSIVDINDKVDINEDTVPVIFLIKDINEGLHTDKGRIGVGKRNKKSVRLLQEKIYQIRVMP